MLATWLMLSVKNIKVNIIFPKNILSAHKKVNLELKKVDWLKNIKVYEYDIILSGILSD